MKIKNGDVTLGSWQSCVMCPRGGNLLAALGFTEDEMDDVAGERRHGLKELPSKKLPDKQQQKAGQMAVVCQTIP